MKNNYLDRLNEIENDIKELLVFRHSVSFDESLKYNEKLKKLYESKDMVLLKLAEESKNVVASDGEIELIPRYGDSEIKYYYIRLVGTTKIVGFIKNGIGEYYSFGDVYFYINEEYRGNNYCAKAFALLNGILDKKGISEVYANVESSNVPSLKIVEKFNGELVEKISVNNTNEALYSYRILTRKKKDNS